MKLSRRFSNFISKRLPPYRYYLRDYETLQQCMDRAAEKHPILRWRSVVIDCDRPRSKGE